MSPFDDPDAVRAFLADDLAGEIKPVSSGDFGPETFTAQGKSANMDEPESALATRSPALTKTPAGGAYNG